MIRKLVIIMLSGIICLLGITSIALANMDPIKISSVEQAKELGSWPTLQEYERVTGKIIEKFSESSMLRTRVATGELPPVEERLPEEPQVVEPIEEIGQYGGTARTTGMGGLGDSMLFLGCEGILRTARDIKFVVPNIVENWDFSEDRKTLTLYLRKGMKWSDGVPLTADDFLFWYEDMLLNEELTPVIGKFHKPGDEVMEMEKVDDYTVRYHFAAPHPGVLLFGSPDRGLQDRQLFQCKHYLKQFHPRYTPMDKLEKMAKEAGYDYWYQLFKKEAKNGWGNQISSCPTLSAYVLTKKGIDYFKYERNPYYWKVDTAGNQLPYIDKVFVTVLDNVEILNAKIVSGQVDFACWNPKLENYSLYKKNEKEGNYRTFLWQSVYGADLNYQPNQNVKDSVLRKIFQDVRFRRALSLAINREEVNEVVYFGLGVPRQLTVIPQCSYYEEEFAKAYAEYNPEEANRLLDEMGLKWDENHNYRLRPDGKKLHWIVEYNITTPAGTTNELLKEYWSEIGCDVDFKEIAVDIAHIRYTGNLVDMGIWSPSGCTDIQFLEWPMWQFPVHQEWGGVWCPLWGKWYDSGGVAGEAPPEEKKIIWKLYDLLDEMKLTTDEKEKVRLGKEVCRIQAENLWTIGVVGLAPNPVIAANNLQNIPEKALWGWDVVWSCYLHPEQFFFKQK